MVASLGDPASYYLPASEYEEYKLTLTNQYIGIGVTTQYNENYGYLTVLSVTPGSPADQAHVKVGNMIASVDSIDVSTYTPEQFDELLRSYDAKETEAEKYFTLHLLNTQGGKADAKMKCELIYAEPVVYYILDSDANKANSSSSVGYLRIRNFDDSAAASVKTAVAALQDSGATSLIIDVRDNTSGKPAEMADALDYFLPKAICSSCVTATGRRRRIRPQLVSQYADGRSCQREHHLRGGSVCLLHAAGGCDDRRPPDARQRAEPGDRGALRRQRRPSLQI